MKIEVTKGTNGEPITLLTPSLPELAWGMRCPEGASYPLPFTNDPDEGSSAEGAPSPTPIKGGPGSGDFGHEGIPGHLGGSAAGSGGGEGGTLTGGPATPAPTTGIGSHASSAPVNIGSAPHMASALDKFITSSPSLSRAATSPHPLPKGFFAAPAGSKAGEPHLAEVMRATGVDSTLPNKASLTIGAKSLFLPVANQSELTDYMEKRLAEKGPRSAATAGFFKPSAASGANAHAQLKKEAKVAEQKTLEKARVVARTDAHALLLSAIAQAAITGDWTAANALEVRYQLTGGIETFGLLMGYQAIDLGAQTGTLVLDRAALDINPTPILGIADPSTFGGAPGATAPVYGSTPGPLPTFGGAMGAPPTYGAAPGPQRAKIQTKLPRGSITQGKGKK